VVGNPPWTKKGKFATISSRLENAEELDKLVEEWTTQHTAEEVMTLLQEAGVAAGIVQDAKDLAQDPQLRGRSFFIKVDHPIRGEVILDGNPIKLSATPAQCQRAAPLLGQDNNYVYQELLGMKQEEIVSYTEQGIFY
jgi:crotonobetainyl-CoA:carnitine CoA-transferase CaiB-like acyl-CoA transferase